MAKALRILHCFRAPVGGLFRHVCDLATEQSRQGHLVGVICDQKSYDPLTAERLDILSRSLALGLKRVPMSREVGLDDVAAYKATRDFAVAGNFDVLHGHGAKGGAYARLVAHALRRRGSPIGAFYTPHGGSLNYRPGTLQGKVYMRLERWLAPMTDGIVCESAFAARRYIEQVTPSGPPQRIVPNGVRESEFQPPVRASDATDFLFIGELRPIKGVDILLRALASFQSQRAASLTIVGAGPNGVEYESLAKDLGLERVVRFAGAKPASVALTLGRCLVMPSRAESFPYVILETAAAGMPIISTSVGGIPEITEGTDMRLIASEDVAALAAEMTAFLDDEQAALGRAERLRARMRDRFTVETMATDILTFYEACLDKRAQEIGARGAISLARA